MPRWSRPVTDLAAAIARADATVCQNAAYSKAGALVTMSQSDWVALRDAVLLCNTFAHAIVANGPPQNGDWACAECRPQSDMLVAGFRCAYHRARDVVLATVCTSPEPADGVPSPACATQPPSSDCSSSSGLSSS